MRLNLFPYLCLWNLLAYGTCQNCASSDDLTNLMQFGPMDPFADVKSGRYLRELEHLITDSHESPEAVAASLHENFAPVLEPGVVPEAMAMPQTVETRNGTFQHLEDANMGFHADDPTDTPGHQDAKDWITVYALLAVILVALSPIAFYDSWHALFIVMVYLASVTLVKVFVKETITQGFAFSETITSLHMICVALVVLCFERPRLDDALPVLPISILNGVSLLTNNKAFLYGGVAFVSMVAANVPFVTFLLELCKGKRSFNLPSVLMVSLVCAGSVCCVRGEPQASLAAFILAAVSAVLRSARGVWQHELVAVNPAPLQLVFWNGAWSLVITVMTMAFSEGTTGLRSIANVSSEAKVALFCSIVAAVLLNITQWFAMKALGALMASIVGNLNLVLVIALSTAWLHEHVTFWQYVGVALLCAGTFGNKVLDMLKKRLEQKATDQPAEKAETGETPLK